MNALGYEVIIPKHTESGRAAISKGCWRQAKRYAEKNIRLLKDLITDETPLVGIEPSCILTFRDEYPALMANDANGDASLNDASGAKQLAKNCLLFDEFIMREVEAGRITSEQFSDMEAEIWLHGHCHQKALVGVEKTAAMYEKAHYKTSIAIGEMILFPAVSEAVKQHTVNHPVFIAAPGISCRTQIEDGTGIKALHPIEILYRLKIEN